MTNEERAGNEERLRATVLRSHDALREAHGESCDCETCLLIQTLTDIALAATPTQSGAEGPADAQIIEFAKTLLKEIPRCTGCDMHHGWDDHVLSIARAALRSGAEVAAEGPTVILEGTERADGYNREQQLGRRIEKWLDDLALAGSLSPDERRDIHITIGAEVAAAPGLSEAWAEAEAALPEDWELTVSVGGHGNRVMYTAAAGYCYSLRHYRQNVGPARSVPFEMEHGPTPAAALLALAARLTAKP